MNTTQVKELLLQSLEHERGGVLVYRTALECVRDERLAEEWTHYLEQTLNHVDVLTEACASLGLDPLERTPGCEIVRQTGTALVVAMKSALAAGDPAAAELVACDCVVLAETKDHANWGLIGECGKAADGDAARVLRDAYERVENEEDEHLYHSKGWCRELWLQALGLEAVLPPPEETEDVKTAPEAARAKDKARSAR